MPTRAIAFHESVSAKKLEELFRSDWHQLFAGTTVGHCKRCGGQFAIFFPSGDDKDNTRYLFDLEKMISDDCREGRHIAEYRINA